MMITFNSFSALPQSQSIRLQLSSISACFQPDDLFMFSSLHCSSDLLSSTWWSTSTLTQSALTSSNSMENHRVNECSSCSASCSLWLLLPPLATSLLQLQTVLLHLLLLHFLFTLVPTGYFNLSLLLHTCFNFNLLSLQTVLGWENKLLFWRNRWKIEGEDEKMVLSLLSHYCCLH